MSASGEHASARRAIRSFVKRGGRITQSQQRALQQLWPVYGIEYHPEQTLEFATLFPGLDCCKLEIGFGNGDALIHMAARDASCGYIGIEVHEPGVGHCLQRIQQQELSNVRIIAHDAVEVLHSMIPARSLDAVFLFFPDPWHKKRHHKRRIVNAGFREQMARVLKPGAVLHLATDWPDYAEHMANELLVDTRFVNLGDDQGFSEKPAYRPSTRFEQRGIRLGHPVHDLLFTRR